MKLNAVIFNVPLIDDLIQNSVQMIPELIDVATSVLHGHLADVKIIYFDVFSCS